MQKRYGDFDSLLTSALFKGIISNLCSNVLLTGGELTPASNNVVNISPHSLVLPDGILLVETEQRQVSIPTTSQKSYTIRYNHIDQDIIGGVAAILEVVEGLFQPADVPNTTVLGWVKYTSGSLSPSMVYRAPRGQINTATSVGDLDFQFADANLVNAAVAANVTPVLTYADPFGWYVNLQNVSLNTATVTFNQYFPVRTALPKSVVTTLVKDNTVVLSAVVKDSQGLPTLTSSMSFTPPGVSGIVQARLRILSGSFVPGTLTKVETTLTIPAGSSAKVISVGVGDYDQPF